jgi:hypothetical protein
MGVRKLTVGLGDGPSGRLALRRKPVGELEQGVGPPAHVLDGRVELVRLEERRRDRLVGPLELAQLGEPVAGHQDGVTR